MFRNFQTYHPLYQSLTFLLFPTKEPQIIKFSFYQNEEETATIDSVIVYESLRFRLFLLIIGTCLMGLFFSLAARGGRIRSDLSILLVLIVISIFLSLPLFRKSILDGGFDMRFHLMRIGTIANQLRQGVFPVFFSPEANNGYGYLVHVFYGSLWMYIPAIMNLLDVPLYICMAIFLLLVNMATVGISYYCFSKMTASRIIGIAACIAFSFDGYRLYETYGNLYLGAILAKIFIPLVVYGIWKILSVERSDIRTILPLAFGMSGMIASHVLSCEILGLAVGLWGLLNLITIIKRRKLIPFIKATILGLLLSAWYIVPFLDSYAQELLVKCQKADIVEALSFGRLLSPTASGDIDGMIGISRLIATIFAIYFFWAIITWVRWKIGTANNTISQSQTPQDYTSILSEKEVHYAYFTVFVITILAVIMSSDIFPWVTVSSQDNIVAQLLSMCQFSNRYITVVVAGCIVLLCRMLSGCKKAIFNYGALIIISIFSVVLLTSYTRGYLQETTGITHLTLNNEVLFNVGRMEYAPIDKPRGDVREMAKYNTPIILGDKVILPYYAYKHSHLYNADGQPVSYEKAAYGQMMIPLESYDAGMYVHFEPPYIWYVAYVLSLITLIGVLILVKT